MSRHKILVVDDMKAHRNLVRRFVSSGGFHANFVEADSIVEARKVLSNLAEELTVALIDLNLTDGRGTTLIREMRTNERFKTVPIIVVSTSTLDTDREDSLLAGATRYLPKSNDLEEFRASLLEVLTSLLS